MTGRTGTVSRHSSNRRRKRRIEVTVLCGEGTVGRVGDAECELLVQSGRANRSAKFHVVRPTRHGETLAEIPATNGAEAEELFGEAPQPTLSARGRQCLATSHLPNDQAARTIRSSCSVPASPQHRSQIAL